MSEEVTQPLPNDFLKLVLARFDAMDRRFDSMDKRFDSVETRLDSMDGRLTAVEEKVDRRLQETRPIWERALAEIAELRRELNHGLRRIDKQVDVLNRSFLEVRADLLYLDERVTKLEPETP
jgi:chromosome segregation ATPase